MLLITCLSGTFAAVMTHYRNTNLKLRVFEFISFIAILKSILYSAHQIGMFSVVEMRQVAGERAVST